MLAGIAASTNTAHIIGTTGLDEDQMRAVAEAAKETVVIQAPNFSLGVNLLMALTRQVAQTLNPEFDIEIVEMHHRHKVDAPSGTALGLGHAAAEGRGVNLNDVADRVRDDITAENAINLWCVSDNLRKGAALNAVQIAELLGRRCLKKAA